MANTPTTWIVEGLDRLGKSTLIENIQNYRGAHQVIHSGKPPIMAFYDKPLDIRDKPNADITWDQRLQVNFQNAYFLNAFRSIAANKKANVIYDRLHLGETVYSPLYRNTVVESVMANESIILGRGTSTSPSSHVRMILLTEDFTVSKHFVSDGESFDDSKRKVEQDAFISAFRRSVIQDRRIICVTGSDGNFKHPLAILAEALA